MTLEKTHNPLINIYVYILIEKEGYSYLPHYKKWLVLFLIKLFSVFFVFIYFCSGYLYFAITVVLVILIYHVITYHGQYKKNKELLANLNSRYDRGGFLTNDEVSFILKKISLEHKKFILADSPIQDILKNIFDYECTKKTNI